MAVLARQIFPRLKHAARQLIEIAYFSLGTTIASI